VVNKLYLLNTNQFNNLGYRYDIRLPMIMSLREDVMEREKRKKEISGADTPTGVCQCLVFFSYFAITSLHLIFL